MIYGLWNGHYLDDTHRNITHLDNPHPDIPRLGYYPPEHYPPR